MAKRKPGSIDVLASGNLRGRMTYKGQNITVVGEKGETEAQVRRKMIAERDRIIKEDTVSSNWKVGEWIDYWMENYKKPLPADFLEEHLREKHKGGRVTATSFDDIKKALKRMKNTETGKKILKKQLVSVNTNDVQMVINELEKKGL